MELKAFLSVCLLMIYGCCFGQVTNEEADSIPSKKKLTIAIKESPPFSYKNNTGEFTGISVYLWRHIAKELNVDYEFKEMTLPEILESLEQSTVDLAINPLTVTSERIKNMRFTQPFFISNSIIVTKERQIDHAQSILFHMFSFNFLRALFLLIIALISFGTVLWLFERKHNDQFSNGLHGWWTGIWWSAATMTTVGYGDKTPKTVIGQMIGIVLMFVALMVVSGLMAGISSALTLEQLEDEEWDHVQDLRKVKAGTIDESASDHFLDHHLIKTTKVGTVKEGLEAVANERLEAFVYDEPILRWEIDNDSLGERFRILPFRFNKQYYAFATPKEDSLTQAINPILLQVLETADWKAVLSDYDLHGL